MKSIRRLKQLKGKTVVMRIDTNVVVAGGRVLKRASFRLDAVLPSISRLVKEGARVVLLGHRGRPDGCIVDDLSLKPVARYFKHALKQNVLFLDSFDEVSLDQVRAMKDGDVAMLENVRFHSGEDNNDASFSRWLAQLGDIYVNDCFGASHRKTASLVGITKYMPSYAGELLIAEMRSLDEVLKKPRHPMVVVMGGVKVETKLPVIKNLLGSCEQILLGGVLANTFYDISCGRVVDEVPIVLQKKIKQIMKTGRIQLPHDVVVIHKKTKKVSTVSLVTCGGSDMYTIMDIGPETARQYAQIIGTAAMVVWNGPLGKFEEQRFSFGTMVVADALKKTQGRVFAGGGETLQIISMKNMKDVYWVSTGGGAMLTYLSGNFLPALRALG